MEPIIRVRNLSKRYRIGEAEGYRTLRESIVRTAAAPMRLARGILGKSRNGGSQAGAARDAADVWALRDISFDVMPGEVLGLIGRNGAGKSTLLKVLSRITEPTAGRAEIYGRVGSLLEVGTGFHAELTGRENIYLSGAILGMRRAEIQRKFDEIVAFAEVEKFIDTPVKRYSSGMHVRLGFAVAAHLEPEILLVDEVLAVGDVAFQKKCLGKMGEVARAGRTVIFVSHNMASIEALCGSCLLINGGRVEARGEPSQMVMRYMASELRSDGGVRSLVDHPGRRPGDSTIMRRVELRSVDGAPTGAVRIGAPFEIRVSYRGKRAIRPVLGSVIKTSSGAPVSCVSDRFCSQLAECVPRAEATVVCRVGRLMLIPGSYSIDLWLGDPNVDLEVIYEAISFEVLPADLTGIGRLPPPNFGAVLFEATWTLDNA